MPFRNVLLLPFVLLIITSCKTGAFLNRSNIKVLDQMLVSKEMNHHVGFLLKDLNTGQIIKEHQSDKYYTPASNTKILSLAVGLEVLGDSIPFVKYHRSSDTLYIQGLGDPTFLHHDFNSERAIEFLRSTSALVVDLSNFNDERYGSGWSWDDFNGAYQVERSAFPIYGNMVTFEDEKPSISYFESSVDYQSGPDEIAVNRNRRENSFLISGKSGDKQLKTVPLVISDSLILKLLEDKLEIPVSSGKMPEVDSIEIKFSQPIDSLYRPMMEESDNFFADQIVMMSAQQQFGYMAEDTIINWAKKSFMQTEDEFLWIDGSGLSRYNQFTPRSIVQILQQLEKKYGLERMMHLFPKGGNTGTISNWYGGENGTPFIYAKTGTLRNVHALSGYLKADSGRWFVFSFMHNNFPGGSSTVKQPMEKILRFLKSEL